MNEDDHRDPEPGTEIVPYDPETYAEDRDRVETGFWAKVRKTLGQVPFVEEAVAAYYCAIDRDTPLQVKAIIMGALAYFVLPTDMIPDFIVTMGFVDDAAVFYAALRVVAPHIKDRHHDMARQILDNIAPEDEDVL
jgi:uncharacterized membrane protein YkvA (DUF1232 family)